MFLAQPEVVTQVVALVLQGVEGFVLDPPAGAAGTHDLVNVVRGNGDIRNPAETHQLILVVQLPVLQDVDHYVRSRLVKGEPVDEAVGVGNLRLLKIGPGKFHRLATGHPASSCSKRKP